MPKNFIKKVRSVMPTKMVRREQFANRIKNRQRHEQRLKKMYKEISYRHSTKASRFNRWQDYHRLINRSY